MDSGGPARLQKDYSKDYYKNPSEEEWVLEQDSSRGICTHERYVGERIDKTR